MKFSINWKELGKQLWKAVKPVLLGALGGGIVAVTGCSSMQPSDKTQSISLYARAQAMLPLSTCIADKKVKMVFRGKEYTKPEDAAAAIDETRYGRENGEYDGEEDGEKLPSVTPDTVVKCPKCGTRFRVGRALANDAA